MATEALALAAVMPRVSPMAPPIGDRDVAATGSPSDAMTHPATALEQSHPLIVYAVVSLSIHYTTLSPNDAFVFCLASMYNGRDGRSLY